MGQFAIKLAEIDISVVVIIITLLISCHPVEQKWMQAGGNYFFVVI